MSIDAATKRAEAAEAKLAECQGDLESHKWAGDRVVAAEAEVAKLREALEWALPLAELALEECRLGRLKAGHHDIGREEGHPGLWPEEIAKRDRCRQALASKEQDHG